MRVSSYVLPRGCPCNAEQPAPAPSVGGRAHLLESADGPVCLNLARPDDVAALPALLEEAIDGDDRWAVRRAVGGRTSAWLAEHADLLGLPLGVPGTAPDGRVLDREYALLEYDFGLKPLPAG